MKQILRSEVTWWIVGLLVVMVGGVALALYGPWFEGELLPPPRLSPPAERLEAAFDWAPTDLAGKPVSFAAFKGKPIFLNIWATWCGPCRLELPAIERLAGQARLKGVAFLCVSIDASLSAVREFVTTTGQGPTYLHATTLPPAFLTEGIPATFIIAPDGRVAVAELGAANWNDPAVIELLEKLLH